MEIEKQVPAKNGNSAGNSASESDVNASKPVTGKRRYAGSRLRLSVR